MMEPLLKLPNDKIVKEIPRLYYWLEEDGIVCSLGKKTGATVTADETRIVLNDFEKLAGTGPGNFCLLSDLTYSAQNNIEARKYILDRLPKMLAAFAMVTASPTGLVVSSTYLALKNTLFPVKIFDNVEEAKEWLRQHLPNKKA
ncbi:MAG: hypothetical protein M0D57_01340 [Sphingobacteriales bacterium JAD_PAG50586_3]|nr:MAG: hypothetical protein M0D57_01340 [Sphingobacteriales bacterium JAD_PAG50586_3]